MTTYIKSLRLKFHLIGSKKPNAYNRADWDVAAHREMKARLDRFKETPARRAAIRAAYNYYLRTGSLDLYRKVDEVQS